MCTWRELGLVASTGGRILHRDGPSRTDCNNRSTTLTRPTTCSAWACTVYPSHIPRLRSLATVLGVYDGAAELDEGQAIVIAGLRSQLLN